MKYYVVGSKVTISTATAETVREALMSLESFNGFSTKEEAEKLAAFGQNPKAKTAYAVYEITAEGNNGIVAEDFKMKGVVHHGFDFTKAQLQNFELVDAFFKGNTFNYKKDVVVPVGPVDNTDAPVVNTDAPVDQTDASATTTRLAQLQAFASKYSKELLAGAAYALTTAAVVATQAIPAVATFAVAKGFAVPAALLATTVSAPIVAAAAVATATAFGITYAASFAITAVAAKAKAAYTRYNMNAQQRHEVDYPEAKAQLAQLKEALADKTDEDKQFINDLHAFKKAAAKPSFDAEGKATQEATVVTRPVVVQFEIEAMKRLNNVAADKRAETEATLLQEARTKFTPAATN